MTVRQVPQYYVKNHHEGIISEDEFELVKVEMARRNAIGKYVGTGVFACMIKCEDCGDWYSSVVAVNKLITEKDEIIENVKLMMDTVCDTAALEKELRGLQTEFEVLTRQIEELIAKNSIKALDQEEYQKSYEELVTKYDECRDKIEETNEKITKKQLKKASLKAYIKALPSWGLTES